MNEDFKKIDELMSALNGREYERQSSETIKLLFELHNKTFPNNKEYSTTCGGCRQRVYNRLKDYWLKNKD